MQRGHSVMGAMPGSSGKTPVAYNEGENLDKV